VSIKITQQQQQQHWHLAKGGNCCSAR